METGHRFKVSFKRMEKRDFDLAIPGLFVLRVIHFTTAIPNITQMHRPNDIYIFSGRSVIQKCLGFLETKNLRH